MKKEIPLSEKSKLAVISFRHRDKKPIPMTAEVLIEQIIEQELKDKGSIDFICKYDPVLKQKVLDRMEKLK